MYINVNILKARKPAKAGTIVTTIPTLVKSKLKTIKIDNCNKAQIYRKLHKDPIQTIILTAKTIITEYKDDNFNCNQSSNLNPN